MHHYRFLIDGKKSIKCYYDIAAETKEEAVDKVNQYTTKDFTVDDCEEN